MERACRGAGPDGCRDRVIFDREHVFADGMRMLVQVVEAVTRGEPAWVQGVLFDPAGNEMPNPDSGEAFLGDYEVECGGAIYSLSVERAGAD